MGVNRWDGGATPEGAEASGEAVYQILCDAVRRGQTVSFYYHGRRRRVAPCVVGIVKGRINQGRLGVLGYQYGGASRRGMDNGTANWRLFLVDKIGCIDDVEAEWPPGLVGRVTDGAFERVLARIP
ncbi:MAG: hypothetical protein ACFCBW_07430 [Candidatus Competibacterales bacterium]